MMIRSGERQQIAVLVDPGDSWGRGVILGISAASRHLLPWDLLIAPRDDQWRFRVPPQWKGDGIIAAIRDEKTAEHVRAQQLPAVNVSAWQNPHEDWYRVNTDDHLRAEMAFDHFRSRGFRHFAYYGPPSLRYPDKRGTEFADVVKAAGASCTTFEMPADRVGWQSVKEETILWLQRAPRPLAVFAADPHPGIQLTEICKAAGFRIPEEIAILAGDTDDLLCEVSDPPLSSIVLASGQIGTASVEMLRQLLNQESPASSTVLIPPVRVIERQSTDILAVGDPLFVDALRFIRERARTGILVQDVLQAVPISRRTLELKFQQYLSRSPADVILRVKLERVKQLLTSSDWTIEQIAHASGFSGAPQLCFAFKRELETTPAEFRRNNRSRIS
ncbi:substrate-binding domain-containing protein [Planctomicrobium sp. SH664]|uniref:XylR family transcriptional regulator n=1 Tax=Planctomicrobium sp. SH664 TaxID=3448125 RepID=UPI003F5B08D7